MPTQATTAQERFAHMESRPCDRREGTRIPSGRRRFEYVASHAKAFCIFIFSMYAGAMRVLEAQRDPHTWAAFSLGTLG